MFIQDEKNRTVWKITLGLACGILLGGGTASFENHACAQSDTLSAQCFAETPKGRVAEGMVAGAFASGGALLLIELWARYQNGGSDRL